MNPENLIITPQLLEHYRKCPAYFKRLISGESQVKETEAFQMGHAAHVALLEGEAAFHDAFLVGDGPINPKTGAPYGKNTKIYKDWVAQQEKPVVDTDDAALYLRLKEAIRQHEQARTLLENGTPRLSVTGTIGSLTCEARMDYVQADNARLVELKTTCNMDAFESDIRKYRYLTELAMKRRLYRATNGSCNPTCFFVVVEKVEPYRVGVWQVENHVLDEAENLVVGAAIQLSCAFLGNNFPTFYEEIRKISTWK